ncbi:G-protein coupled receptor GRL101-like [Littorina saxatilis]|uniref:G-protein coupled receptor GRL101-like n=1 Tax=Littorina saxatilis TaxID=31220 RepID=UPI0038B69EBC
MTLKIEVGSDEVILVSFPHFDIENHTECRYDSLQLSLINSSGTSELYDSLQLSLINSSGTSELWRRCGVLDLPAQVFHNSVYLKFVSDDSVQRSGFKVVYTILPKAEEPTAVGDDVFDCSVDHFYKFAHHFNCNLAVNCDGEEDEKNCSYSSEDCGAGSIDAGEKCFTYSRVEKGLSWYDAYSRCLRQNETLANPRDPEEWGIFKEAMSYGKKTATVYTGLRTSQNTVAEVPSLYRDLWQWSDTTIALYVNVSLRSIAIPMCTYFRVEEGPHNLATVSCVVPMDARFVCERLKSSTVETPGGVTLPLLETNATWSKNITLMPCPSGHVVRDFLSCDLQSQCRDERDRKLCETEGDVALFQCEHSSQSVHYTLVCDFRLDCPDGSDENFCVHPQCAQDVCRTGQCLARDHRCDGMQHCDDGSDENCPQSIKQAGSLVPPPAVLYFDGRGGYDVQPLNITDPCPDTHFRCHRDYCLPVYVRCNGMDDCPGREDEVRCDSYECPGFYRCRGSSVCLHPDHLCDGEFQCPQHDDELLCDLQCPDACQCQGLAFLCQGKFSVASFTSLRYLDASGSGMTMKDLELNLYLVYVRLAKCDLDTIPHVDLGNLRTLDVSYNRLTTLELDSLVPLRNLQVLVLVGNPLVTVVGMTSSVTLPRLKDVNLAWTQLGEINTTVFSCFSAITRLNVSNSPLETITIEGFKDFPNLEVLDLRGCPLTNYPPDVIKDLTAFSRMYADDFKLCCKATLPANFDPENCHAPADDIASCEDLLRSDVYRVFLWLFAILAVLGNAGSFVARFYLQNESFQSSFNVLVTSLSVADFLMGVYLAIIGVADQVYRGRYLWQGETWKNSIACKTAGFLSLLSSEVSAFFICLITLDRLLVLRFPFSRCHLSKKSALIACGIAWVIGFILAVIPLLPMTAHWKFYSQTGICIPLPFSDNAKFLGQSYSFSVMIVLNFVQFVLIAVGQLIIYSAVRAGSLAQAKKKASRDAAIARRLSTIVLSDFLCWFPIGLLGLLASTGTPIPTEVNVGVAIFVLPFNSALNPFLYTFNIVMEKRRKAAEARMLQRLESRHFTELSRAEPKLPAMLTVTKETALNQIEGWLGVRVITLSDLASRFDMMPKMDQVEPSSRMAISDVL